MSMQIGKISSYVSWISCANTLEQSLKYTFYNTMLVDSSIPTS